jgi:hypothetical protein
MAEVREVACVAGKKSITITRSDVKEKEQRKRLNKTKRRG